MRSLAAIATLIFTAYAAGPAVKFEVATIKRCTVDPGTNGGESSPGRITINCYSVTNLIQRSYVLFANGKRNPQTFVPIQGGPAWADSDLYTIVAKAEGTAGIGMMSGPMMQALLEDRFKLKIHRRTTEIPVYALSVAKGGPRLAVAKQACIAMDIDHPFPPRIPGQPAPPLCDGARYSNHGIDLRGATLEQLGRVLYPRLGRPVVNKTGVAGNFDFHLEFPPRVTDESQSPLSRMEILLDETRAALEKLGLRIEPAKGAGEAIVIDHLEKPSEN